MFKFYFELWGVKKDVFPWWYWGGDIGGDPSCDVGLVKLWKFAACWIECWKREVWSKEVYLKFLCRWELFIDDANILSISNSCLRFFPSFSFANSKNARSLSFQTPFAICVFSTAIQWV